MEKTPPSDTRDERYGGTAGRRFQDHSESWVDRHPEAVEGIDADDGRPSEEDASVDEVVERLGRDLTGAVEATRADVGPRSALRAVPIAIVREDAAPQAGPAPRAPARRARLTMIAVAGLLAVAGAVLSFVVPWAGLLCFVMAGLAAVVSTILGSREARTEATVDASDRRP